ncbi:DUF6478 family protein [Poseidonocella sp. HB161398]|uniref:DUF6478 family protein n=1 Tax=Poseidonocella sp. HB161398 TaxID=2320855 RepID=UPI00110948D3|nr:DUF6478 family protein [Poseidonocella sp. HB161398]
MTGGLPPLRALRHPQPVLEHLPLPWRRGCGSGPLEGRFAPDAALFHDGGAAAEIRLEARADGLELSARRFGGSYVSLAIDLPAEMAADLGPAHNLRLRLALAAGNTPLPGGGYLRLTIEENGTPWQMTVPLALAAGARVTPLGPGPAAPTPVPGLFRRGWIDLVFTGMAGRGVRIPHLSLCRAPAPHP